MRLDKKLVGLALGCFFAFLVWQLPARLVFILLPSTVAQGFGVEGSVWNGRARIINAGGQQLRNTEWDVALSRLFLGQLAMDFKTRWGGGFAEGFASISLLGTLRFIDTRASVDAAILSPLLNVPQLGGQISLDIQELELIDNWPHRLTGNLEIRNLASPLMGSGAADLIGNVEVVFDSGTETDSDTLTGRIRDTGGPIELEGTLLLTPPSNYDLDTRVKARPDAAKSVQDNLQFLGSPEPDGSHIFKFAGSI